MPSFRIHTHCQLAQKSQRTNQNLSKSMAAQTHGLNEKIKHENITHGIVHAGLASLSSPDFHRDRFSGFRRFVTRKKCGCIL
jgi:hypothetical protein